jgi:hypothetical protein
MIIIDKSKEVQNIILTLSELTTIVDVKYLVVLKSDATREIFKFILPINVSPATSRYDLFKVDTAVFLNMPTGYFSYRIYQTEIDSTIDESLLGEFIECGKLLIQSLKINTPVADKYIIYK